MYERIIKITPVPIKKLGKRILSIPYVLGNNRYCPICEKSSRKFGKHGIIPRLDVCCMHCESLERHRLVWMYLQRKTNLFDGFPKKMLHIAPESGLEKLFKIRLGDGYLSGDLNSPIAMIKIDITDINYSDNSFDVIYCSHVLEHVPKDRQAIGEFYRVLKLGGWALILVPITAEKTFEDTSVKTPEERLKIFGQKDHVRRYGPDFIQRLKEAGFKVSEIKSTDFLNEEEIKRMKIGTGTIFLCKK